MKTKSKSQRRARKGRQSSGARITNESNAATAENFSALRLMKSMKGPNNKYINAIQNSLQSSSVTITNPYVALLNGVVQGTTENTRIGRLTTNKWLDLDLDIYGTSSLVGQSSLIRAYVIAETTALGSALAPSQFFIDSTNFAPISQRDRTNRNASRYVVLWDSKPMNLGGLPAAGSTASTGISPAERVFSVHIPLNFQTDYSRGNAGTVADIDTNSIHLMVVTDNGTANAVVVYGAWTLCFNDDS